MLHVRPRPCEPPATSRLPASPWDPTVSFSASPAGTARAHGVHADATAAVQHPAQPKRGVCSTQASSFLSFQRRARPCRSSGVRPVPRRPGPTVHDPRVPAAGGWNTESHVTLDPDPVPYNFTTFRPLCPSQVCGVFRTFCARWHHLGFLSSPSSFPNFTQLSASCLVLICLETRPSGERGGESGRAGQHHPTLYLQAHPGSQT